MPKGLVRAADELAFRLGRWIVFGLFQLYFGLRVRGRVPSGGPFVLCANHTSMLDAVLVGLCSHRRIRFMMTDMFAGVPGLRWFFRWNRVLMVREEGSNRSVFEAALGALRAGDALGVFPEGGISRDGKLKELRSGAVAMALRAGVPIVPLVVSGAFRALPRWAWFPRPATIRVRIGKAIPAAELAPDGLLHGEALEYGVERLRQALAELAD